jgi:hypothetical protein
VLVIAGGVQGRADDTLGELIEDEQVGFELADFVFDFIDVELPLAALAFDQCAIGPVGSCGLVAFVAAAEVLANDPAVDAAGAVVIAFAVGSGFPGHGGFGSGAGERGAAEGQDMRARADARMNHRRDACRIANGSSAGY